MSKIGTVEFTVDDNDEEAAVDRVQAELAANQTKPESALRDYIVRRVD